MDAAARVRRVEAIEGFLRGAPYLVRVAVEAVDFLLDERAEHLAAIEDELGGVAQRLG